MHVFLTGATGFIGARIVPELVAAGHQVLGLCRSDAGAAALRAAGAEPHHGTLEHPEGLAYAAARTDATIHCAFDHDFANFAANCEKDRRVIEAIGTALAGTDRPFIITSGTGLGSHADGSPATEDHVDWNHPNPRSASEKAGAAMADRGASVAIVRLPQVHDPVKQGLITPLLELTRSKGAIPYVNDGTARWPAAHVTDVARLYRLALEHHQKGARYHAVAEEGVPARAIAEALAHGLGLQAISITPDQAPEYFGWMAMFANLDMPASSTWTRTHLGWEPTGPSLLEDLAAMDYGMG